jgi:hypothetical protein
MSTAQRIKTENLLVKYYSNPFIETHKYYNNPSVESLNIEGSEVTEDNKNIVGAVSGLRKLQLPSFPTADFHAVKKEYEDISKINKKIESLNQMQQDKSKIKIEK